MSSYLEKLKDPRWQKKRLTIFNRDKWACVKCGNKKLTLHVHHLSYRKGKEPWEYPNKNLQTYCEKCHSETHKKPAPSPVKAIINPPKNVIETIIEKEKIRETVSLPPVTLRRVSTKLGALSKIREMYTNGRPKEPESMPLTIESLRDAWMGYHRKLAEVNNPAAISFNKAILVITQEKFFVVQCENNLDKTFIEHQRDRLIQHFRDWFKSNQIGYLVFIAEQPSPWPKIGSLARIREQYKNR